MIKIFAIYLSFAFLALSFLQVHLVAADIPPTKISSQSKIGVIIPLTGPIANWGRSIQLGIQFSAQKIGPTAAQFVFEDEAACDATKALSAAHKLLNVDKVEMILTGCLNGTKAILPLAKRSNVLVVSLGLVDETLARDNRGYLITPSASISAEADGISKLLAADGKKKLAVIRVEDNFTEEIMSGLTRYSARDGWKLGMDERLTFSTNDFRSILLKISRTDADAVLIYAATAQTVNAMRQFKDLRISSLAVYGGYVIEADPPPAQDMVALNGVRYAAVVTPVDDELSRYLHVQNSKETFQTRVAADVMADINTALGVCEDSLTNINCLKNSFVSRTENTPAFSGGFSYDQDGLANRKVRSKVVRDGNYEWIDKN